MTRPAVSVIVPLRGDRHYAERALVALRRLELRPGDELIVADNTPEGVAAPVLGSVARVVSAAGQPSSYFARNSGVAAAGADWLLFIDADCVPVADLLDRYFAEPIGERCGAVAGGIVGIADQDSLLTRYARDRNFLDQAEGMHGSAGVAAATGNLLIRRTTFAELGGFADGIRSGGDVDFCWRMRKRGWTLEQRPEARVEHRHREDLASFLGMIARYGAGSRWLNERHPGTAPRWPLVHGLVGTTWDVGAHLVRGRLEPAAFRVLDGLGLVAHNLGYRASNEVG
ncbi:MAG: glycosyltransferase [Vicinamibacteria bacterium]